MIDFRNKKVTVLGLARSGFACAQLLKELGALVFVSEKEENQQKKELAIALKKLLIDCELGRHTRSIIENSDYIVLSPGIPLFAMPVVWATKKNIPIIGEIEVAYQVCHSTIIAITGTNGKSTVTTLVGEVIKEAGKKVFVGGNIGTPFCSFVAQTKLEDYISLEVSSFQLETIKEFRPKISVILNITPDHLDRYKSLEEYLQAKKRIFMNQEQNDFLILNKDDQLLVPLAKETRAKVLFFSAADGDVNQKLNLNQLAVLKVAKALGISEDICFKVFKNFRGIEHRLEFVREIDGVEFINDSKATNVDSVRWALQNINKSIILLAGGRDKGADFSLIKDLVSKKVKAMILFGEAAEKMEKAFRDSVDILMAKDIQDATEKAFRLAKRGDCVLLSPMCASFDMFNDYQHRGRVFKEIVAQVK